MIDVKAFENKKYIYIENNDGIKEKCMIVFTSVTSDSKKIYVGLTNGKLDNNNKLIMYVKILEGTNENPILKDIENENEMRYVYDILIDFEDRVNDYIMKRRCDMYGE